jgi:DNA-binding response OmpR family regulator
MAEKIKVGVVSSHVDTVTNICNYLEGKGFKAVWVYNNEEVSNLCQKENPDVVVINVSKDHPEGFEVAKKLKNLKIIFMSADDELSGKASKIANCVGFIKKPIDLEELENKIALAFKNKSSDNNKEKKVFIVL